MGGQNSFAKTFENVMGSYRVVLVVDEYIWTEVWMNRLSAIYNKIKADTVGQ